LKRHDTLLVDPYHRRLSYLRVSITDRCNLRCLYCMPRKGVPKLRHEDILTYEEIIRVCRIALSLGMDKIRLTGGEPLLRKGIFNFLPQLTALPGLRDVSLTTNGVFLAENLDKIRASGLKRLNISLDTLKGERYVKITDRDCFEKVWEGLTLARKKGFNPLKINVVVIRHVNDDEILDFARLTLDHPYHVRFIEYMPMGPVQKARHLEHVPNAKVKERIAALGALVPIPKEIYDGPAERFRVKGALGEVGFISALTHHFCPACNRLRLTARGALRPCLLSGYEQDLKGPMRQGATDEEVARIFLNTARHKPYAHHVSLKNDHDLQAYMSSIGG